MSDVVVTVPKALWQLWLEEGDAAGQPPSGTEWGFFLGGGVPKIERGERVYVVAHGLLRGYAPLTRVERRGGHVILCREAGAVAVTIPEAIKGFQGWRYRWWEREVEASFEDWKTRCVA